MRGLLIGLALALGMTAMTMQGVGGTATGAEEKPIRVLFVLGSPPFHDIVKLPPILEKRLAREGGFQVKRLEPPPGMPEDPAHLARLAQVSRGDVDVVMFYTSRGELPAEAAKALDTFVKEGGGIVALHGASGSFKNAPAWEQLLGGQFIGHAPGTHKLGVAIVDPQHPITRGLSDFEVVDEEYCHTLVPNAERHVLGRFKNRPENSRDPNGPREMIWTRQVGKGRVFYNALGHNEESWNHPTWQELNVRGLRWAAGRS